MDLAKLTTSDRMILGGGIAYLIFMFFPWYGYDFGPAGDYSNSGWDYFLGGILPLILIAVMCSHVLVSAFSDTQLPDPPVPWSQVHFGTGVVAAVIVVLRLLIGSDEVGSFDTGVSMDRKFGLILAVIAAIVVAVGGVKKSQETDSIPPPSGGGPGTAPF